MLPHIELATYRLPSYLVMLVLALAAGSTVAVERARRDGLDPRRVAVVAATASIAGVIGARMWSVLLEHWPLHGELQADSIWTTSGLGLFGGLVMGAVATVALSHRLGVSKESIADAMAPGVAVGISVGRIGCLLAGCCYGLPTLFPVAIVVSDFDAAT